MTTHKAYRLHGYGGRDQITLDDVQVPTPALGQVLVEIDVVAINPFDWKVRNGYVKDFIPLDLPTVMGFDLVGRVKELGPEVSRLAVGDRVMTMSTHFGAFAEHIAVDENILARLTDNLSDLDAATLPTPGMSAWTAVKQAGPIAPGAKVLIHGSSGVVGAIAIQLAKEAGAYVIGTASAKNRDFVMSLGADECIDYTTERFEDRVKDIDVVLDFVLVAGMGNTVMRSWAVLRAGGTIVSLVDPSVLNVPDGFNGYFPDVSPDAAVLEDFANRLASGKLKTKIAAVYPRDGLLDAMDASEAGGTHGRLLVEFKK
jgi:NADPH:quinone reductase-like Zn-dependent oxidoreductase